MSASSSACRSRPADALDDSRWTLTLNVLRTAPPGGSPVFGATGAWVSSWACVRTGATPAETCSVSPDMTEPSGGLGLIGGAEGSVAGRNVSRREGRGASCVVGREALRSMGASTGAALEDGAWPGRNRTRRWPGACVPWDVAVSARLADGSGSVELESLLVAAGRAAVGGPASRARAPSTASAVMGDVVEGTAAVAACRAVSSSGPGSAPPMGRGAGAAIRGIACEATLRASIQVAPVEGGTEGRAAVLGSARRASSFVGESAACSLGGRVFGWPASFGLKPTGRESALRVVP